MRTQKRLIVCVAAMLLTPWAFAPSAQQTPPATPQQPGLTFRTTANYVEVDAIVTDERGEIVRDLKAADFDVVEDGRPQELTVCSFVDIPIVRPDPPLFKSRVIEPDVVTNDRPFDGRVFLLVLDRYHVAAKRTAEVRREALRFIDRHLGENDLAAVVLVGKGSAGQEFTSNKRLLSEAVTRFTGEALPTETENMLRDALRKNDEKALIETLDAAGNVTIRVTDPGPPRDQDRLVREYMARESLDVVRRVAQDLVELNGRRKALLLFSEGIGIDLLKPDDAVNREGTENGVIAAASNISAIVHSQREMFRAAARGNVSIYAIDPRGLASGGGDASLPGSPAAPVQGGPVGGRSYATPALLGDIVTEQRRAQDSLRTFSEATGGLPIVDQNDMGAAFDRIVKDNSSYYILGYRSPDPRRDGRFHRLEVKAKRAGLQVRSRTGYYAPSDKVAARRAAETDPIVKLLATPTPIGGLGMRASAAVMKGLLLHSTVHLTIEFNGKDVMLKPDGALLTNDITVEYLAIDMKGTAQANGREVAQVRLQPKFHATFPQNGVRYLHEFALAPGRYQLRVAAREALGGRTGSVFLDLDVPDFAVLPVAVSDVLLTSSRAEQTATGKSTPAFGALLPTPPVTTRAFTTADTLTALAAFYDNVREPQHSVDLKVTVQSDTGGQVLVREDTRPNGDLDPAKGGYRWTVSVPLAGFSPGRYVLTLEARTRLGAGPAVTKEVEFRVR